jgi:CHRD domain/PEP-CTERM motif
MKKQFIAAVSLAFLYAASAEATVITFTASLSGANESPANASPGTGTALVTYDDSAHTLRVELTFADLVGPTTASHIHCCTAVPDAGTAGIATVTPTFTGFPLGVTSGTYDHTFDLTMLGSFNPAFVTANGGTFAGAEAALGAGLLAGEAYLNIHTSVVPGGEIRGFLHAAPEPATMLLLGLGLGGLLVQRRRQHF